MSEEMKRIIEVGEKLLTSVEAALAVLEPLTGEHAIAMQEFGITEAIAQLKYAQSRLQSQNALNRQVWAPVKAADDE